MSCHIKENGLKNVLFYKMKEIVGSVSENDIDTHIAEIERLYNQKSKTTRVLTEHVK